MASDVLAALDLDKESLMGQFFLIKEMSGSEAHFIHSCLIARQIKDQGSVCLVTLHNSFHHYHCVGQKMGYNLDKLKEAETVKSVDCLSLVSDTLISSKNADCTAYNKIKIDDLFDIVNKAVKSLLSKHPSVFLIVDDITGLLEMGYTIIEVNTFVQLCKSLILSNDKCSIAVGVHVISESDSSFILSGLVSHMADVICEVSGFKTGRSRDVSGTFGVSRPWSSISNNLVKLNSYHYKLFDRGIKVFAPGSK